MPSIVPGATFDGYELIRVIGQGGFGTVWLARSGPLDCYLALKVVESGSHRELKAVQAYKKLAMGGIDTGLMPIEHVGFIDDRLFYVMPLSDDVAGREPIDPVWQPATLSARFQEQMEKGTWFTSQEIVSWFADICKAVQTLSDSGLAHRDIKPDNILFFQGRPVISDVSLLTSDVFQGTRYGTPGFTAPSWYVDTGGKIDMFSIAATLFTTLTGQSPDKMGRAAFQWPPKGKESLSVKEQGEWQRLHRIVLRATHEDAAERFITYSAFAGGLLNAAPHEVLLLKDAVSSSTGDPSDILPESLAAQTGWTLRVINFTRRLIGLFPRMPLIVLAALFFLTATMIHIVIFRTVGVAICGVISIGMWYLFFQGMGIFMRDWMTGERTIWMRVFVALLINFLVCMCILPLIVKAQTSILIYDEGWWWMRHVVDAARANEADVMYVFYSVMIFLFFPSYAGTPIVLGRLGAIVRKFSVQ